VLVHVYCYFTKIHKDGLHSEKKKKLYFSKATGEKYRGLVQNHLQLLVLHVVAVLPDRKILEASTTL